MRRYRILLIVFSLCVLGTIQAQTKKQFLEVAEKEYANKDFYWALVHFNIVLEFDEKDPNIVFKAAESARQFNSYARAAEKYQYLIDTLKDNTHPEALYQLASMKQRMGKYDEAEKYYNLYISEYGSDEEPFTLKSKRELLSLEFAKTVMSRPKRNVNISKMSDDINTTSSDVAGNTYKDDFYFSTMSFLESKPVSKPAKDISKIFKKSKDKEAEMIPGYLNDRDQLISNSSINHTGELIYYTVCSYKNGSEIRCDIYRSNIDTSGVLTDEILLSDPINLANTTSTHPHLTIDKQTGKEVMYFVSDRPGGKGGLDIWSSLLDPKFGFSEPINLTAINTVDDDISPYYALNSDFLFFSSNGRIGLGGFDVYKAGKTNDEYGAVLGLGFPYNSSYNDIYYTEAKNGDKAFLSSNREGALFLDDFFESCCYDIYELEIVKLTLDLNALTYDKLTGRDLRKATVYLIDQDTKEEIARFRNDDGIDHKFDIAEDRNYLIIAERENYYPDTISLSTVGVDKSTNFTKKMYLSTDMMLLDVFTFTKIGKLPLDGVTVTLIDISDPLKKQEVVLNAKSNDFYFMLDRGKEYKLIATKDGYTQAEEYVDTRIYDKPGLIRKDMYLDKFVLQDLLPISLFFDNDLPDIASNNTTTKSKYGDLVDNYVSRKEIYKTKFTKPIPVDQRDEVKEKYEEFFEGDVKGGYDKFKIFLNSLLHELEAGNKVELLLKGFASPRADSKYNLSLGQRRVNSVKNEMIFQNEVGLKKYFLSGQLVITDISFGKELAPDDVIGKLDDERNSIYNIKAAQERRVEILRASRN